MKQIIAQIILAVLLLISSSFGFLKCSESKRLKLQLTQAENSYKEMERVKDNLVLSSREMVSKKTLDKALDENKELKKFLSEKKVEIKYLTKIRTITKYVKVQSQKSDQVKETKDIDQNNKKITEYIKGLKDASGLSVAKVSFKHPSDKPWSYEIYPRKTFVTVINQKERDGNERIIVQTTQEDKDGKRAPLSLVDVRTIIRRPSIRQFVFELNTFQLELYGLFGFGLEGQLGLGAGLGAHLFRIKLKEKEAFRLVGLVAGYSAGAIGVTFHPFSFNLGTLIPFLKDTYITIGVGGGYYIEQRSVGPLFTIGIGSTL